MLSEKIRAIRAHVDLNQRDFAKSLGIKLQRLKHLEGGHVQHLTQDEAKALVEVFGVSGDWLATGEGEMLQTPEQSAADLLQREIREVTAQVQALKVGREMKSHLQSILFAVATRNMDLLESTVAALVGARAGGTGERSPPAYAGAEAGGETSEEERLLSAFRSLCRSDQETALRLLQALSLITPPDVDAVVDEDDPPVLADDLH